MIYVVEAVKGGVGKSTTALYLAEAFVREGRSVLVVDADPQGTVFEWDAAATDMGDPLGVTVEAMPSVPVLHRRLVSRAASFDVTVVDCPNRDVSIIDEALSCADMAIVPMPPGVEELRRGQAGLTLAAKRGIPARILLTLVDLRTTLTHEVLEVLDAESVPRFRSMVRRRADIAACVGTCRPVLLHDYAHVAAELEVHSVIR
jgi:chromosome partitioning protein